ncbi:MAG TPA: antibiotic biosynthesis monooxygenase [Terriglobales bacterium]|nr:antibiotic biosynthesis monooxygenase [Terriglobales bacterium]
MYARLVEIFPKLEKKQEFLRTVRTEVVPILKKQPGFLEILPFVPELENEKYFTITLWAEKRDAERYAREVFPKVADILKPYLISPMTSKYYTVETSVCPHFMEALTA